MQLWKRVVLLVVLAVFNAATVAATPPPAPRPASHAAEPAGAVAVVIGSKPDPLERYAADQLCGYLDRLFAIKTHPVSIPPATAPQLFLIGNPSSHRAVATALTASRWPQVSDQGIVIKRGMLRHRQALVVGGGSPVATLWAVYELVERWGVRYLVDRDIYPEKCRWHGLPDLDVVLEPNMRIRCWRLVNDMPPGPVSWSLEENRRFLRQIAKMKYNRIHLQLWPAQPFVHYSFHGIEKPPGVLFFGQTFSLDNDTIGRQRFGSMTTFTNPELVGATTPRERQRRAIGLIRGILAEARALRFQTGLTIAPVEWPRVFSKVLPGSQKVHQLGGLTASPGPEQRADDPQLRALVSTIVRAYIQTYPHIDYLHISTPEFRGWTSRAEPAYRRLVERYGEGDVASYQQLCAAARQRRSFPGGGKRVEAMLKGDLTFLDFFDALRRDQQLLRRPGGGSDIKLIYSGVVAELFPLVARMVPPGGEVLSFIDYTASRQLRQHELLQHVPPARVPASLVFTLADDNVGVLPQLATGSLHQLLGELRRNHWAGFYTRYWTVSDQDPAVHYLARAAWDASVTPQKAYADQVAHVCGPAAVAPALAAFALLERITLGLDQHGLGFAFPVPGMMTKHYAAGGLSAAVKQDCELYRQALHLMERARQCSRPNGREYLDGFVGRLRFAVKYLEAADAFGAAATAEKADQPHAAARHADVACHAIREAIEAYVGTARNHGDLGTVAVLNAYCYRPIRDKRNELHQALAARAAQ